MCGGFKPSRLFLRSKEDQIAYEMSRLSNLKQNQVYTWPLSSGLEKKPFGGHVRSENLETIWNGKIERHVKIIASEFSERDTIGGSRELKPFSIPDSQAIHGVITKTGELRIVTRQSTGNVAAIHHRMPDLIGI